MTRKYSSGVPVPDLSSIVEPDYSNKNEDDNPLSPQLSPQNKFLNYFTYFLLIPFYLLLSMPNFFYYGTEYKKVYSLKGTLSLLFMTPFYVFLSMPYMYYLQKTYRDRDDRDDPGLLERRIKSREIINIFMLGTPRPRDIIFYALFIRPHEVFTGECYLDCGW